MRSLGGWRGKTILAVGGKGVSLTLGEVYESLRRGTVDDKTRLVVVVRVARRKEAPYKGL